MDNTVAASSVTSVRAQAHNSITATKGQNPHALTVGVHQQVC